MTKIPKRRRGAAAQKALARWLKRQEVSVPDLASRVGVSRKTIYSFLWGTRSPSLSTAIALEKETGIPSKRWVA